jgi:glycerophosphoryl diester phosphodiesterase
MKRATPILYAHRGASLELPENTLEAFGLALDLGAGALETDAHMTRDGHVVLSHDPSGQRMAGVPRAIRDATLTEVHGWDVGARFSPREPHEARVVGPFRMPTLDAALAAFPHAIFNVDAKQVEPDIVPALLRCIRRAKACDRVRIASFSARNLVRVRALGYEGETGLAGPELARIMLAPSFALRWIRPAGDAAQVPRRAYGMTFASQAAIDRLHAVGLRVDFWTVDDPTEARRLLGMGADGIMTDDIRKLASITSITLA